MKKEVLTKTHADVLLTNFVLHTRENSLFSASKLQLLCMLERYTLRAYNTDLNKVFDKEAKEVLLQDLVELVGFRVQKAKEERLKNLKSKQEIEQEHERKYGKNTNITGTANKFKRGVNRSVKVGVGGLNKPMTGTYFSLCGFYSD